MENLPILMKLTGVEDLFFFIALLLRKRVMFKIHVNKKSFQDENDVMTITGLEDFSKKWESRVLVHKVYI